MLKNLVSVTNEEIVLEEEINLKEANSLCHCDKLDASAVTSLVKYLNLYKIENKLIVSYTDDKLVRLKIQGPEPCMTMSNMYNTMKGPLCKGIYYDIDIKNCHPVLLSQLCEFNKIDTPILNNYIKNRNKIISKSGKNKKDFKKDLYKMMFNRYAKTNIYN